jgi:Condensation domain
VELEIAEIELQTLRAPDLEERVERLAQQEAREPFDLSRAPLVRAKLRQLGDQDHVLLLTMRHIVSDAWSMGLVIREMAEMHGAFSQGRPSSLSELPTQ